MNKKPIKFQKTLLLLANGFEILEASAFIDVMGWNLHEGDYSTILHSAGLTKEIKSSFDQKFIADYLVEEINVDSFDALAIPGGFKEFKYYEDAYSEGFLNIIKQFKAKDKPIASVCVGALPVARSGILKNKKGTTYNTTEHISSLKKNGVTILKKTIVIDDNIITSNGPSTATDVAFILLEKLTSLKNVKKVKKLMGFYNNVK